MCSKYPLLGKWWILFEFLFWCFCIHSKNTDIELTTHVMCCHAAKFKEICPGGMGYTVLPNPPVNKPLYQEPIDPPQPLPTPERPVEAFGTPEEIIPGESCNINS